MVWVYYCTSFCVHWHPHLPAVYQTNQNWYPCWILKRTKLFASDSDRTEWKWQTTYLYSSKSEIREGIRKGKTKLIKCNTFIFWFNQVNCSIFTESSVIINKHTIFSYPFLCIDTSWHHFFSVCTNIQVIIVCTMYFILNNDPNSQWKKKNIQLWFKTVLFNLCTSV